MAFDHARAVKFIEEDWKHEDFKIGARDRSKLGPLTNALADYVEIPNLSPAFDPDWPTNGTADKTAEFTVEKVEEIKKLWAGRGAKVDDIAVRIEGSDKHPMTGKDGKRIPPMVVIDVPEFGASKAEGTVMIYGHLDKQPHLDIALWGDTHPTKPCIHEGRLYGRGSSDDGPAVYVGLEAMLALREQGTAHGHVHIILESAEESGSRGIMDYIEKLSAELGDVTLIVCLDGGNSDFDHMWTANSLRGLAAGTLTIDILKAGVHSGSGSGAVASGFRILRMLLSRVEDEQTGMPVAHSLKVMIPNRFRDEAKKMIDVLGKPAYADYPFVEGMISADTDPLEVVMHRTWTTQLAVIGMDGYPTPAESGNVLLPRTVAALSFRLPPTLDAPTAAENIKRILEADPPYGAHVKFEITNTGNGWAAVDTPKWLDDAYEKASMENFGNMPMQAGTGGSIPFMAMLAQKFPHAEIMISGAGGPGSNAHGPRESVLIDQAKRMTACVARVISAHADH